MKYFAMSFAAAGVLLSALPLSAQASSSDAHLQSEIRQINSQTKQLQREVRALRAQLRTAKHGKAIPARGGHSVVRAHLATLSGRSTLAQRGVSNFHNINFGHEVTVTTTPFLGKSTAFDASDLLEQASSMNEDLTLLQQHAVVDQYLVSHGYSVYRPILGISGGLEGQLYDMGGFGGQASDKGISLSTMELDFNALVSPWATGFISVDYNNQPVSQGNREPQGTLYLKRGFITLGDLQKFPVYFTLGETYAPFGKYSSLMLTTPLTQSLGRIRTGAAIVGVNTHGFYGQAYGYSGFKVTGGTAVLKQYGFNAGYTNKFANKISFDAGLGWVSNIASSQGMQNTGSDNGSEFQGFAVAAPGTSLTGNMTLRHDVSALDAHAELTIKNLILISEYIDSLESFNVLDLAYNGVGASPKALHLEADYKFNLFNRPWTVGAMFGRTWQALALQLPEVSYTADIQVSIFKDTLETLEFRHDDDYGLGDTSDGGPNGHPGNTINGTGSTRNAIIGQVGIYF